MSLIRQDELLVQAASRGEVERVRSMLDHRAVVSARNHHLLTALHWAVTMGHRAVVELLIERGADVDAKSADGHTPLHMAAREGDAELVECLLEANANPNQLNGAGQTPVDLATTFAEDQPEVAHALLTAGARRQAAALLTAKPTAPVPTPVETHDGPTASVGCGTDDLESLMTGVVGQVATLSVAGHVATLSG